MNIFQVEVAAPMGRAIREVAIPSDIKIDGMMVPEVLDLIFRYGQNEIQPRLGRASVSVDDTIYYGNGARFRVEAFGFSPITD